MNRHHIERMASVFSSRFDLNQGEIALVIEEYWSDKIALVWSVGDVKKVAKENYGKEITDEQASDILNDIFDNHDPEHGITWVTLDCNVSDYIENNKL